MNEILTANSEDYTVENVETGINTISFKIVSPVPNDVEATFKNVTAFTIKNEEDNIVYGEYPYVEYESLTIQANGDIIVSMHILTQDQIHIRELQVSQLEQDEVIAQMVYGGEK